MANEEAIASATGRGFASTGITNYSLRPRTVLNGRDSSVSLAVDISTLRATDLSRMRFVDLDQSEISSIAGSLSNLALGFLSLDSFNSRQVSVSSSQAISSSSQNGATIRDYNISINRLADEQIVISNTVSKTDTTNIDPGTSTFKITQGNRVNSVDVTVSAGETNQAAFEKIRDAINNQKIGVTASVITPLSGLAQIEIKSNTEGTDSAFTLEDIKGSIISKSGLDTSKNEVLDSRVGGIRQQPQNAEVEIEGTRYEFQTNTIALDQGRVTFNLKKTANDLVVEVKPDFNKILSSTSTLTSTLNVLSSNLNSSFIPKDVIDGKRLGELLTSSRGNLNSIGINVAFNNGVSIDFSQFKNSVVQQPQKVQSILTDFARALSTLGSGTAVSASQVEASSVKLDQVIKSLGTERKGSVVNTIA